MQHERPHENCYWVVPGLLIAGEYPGDKDNDTARTKLHGLLRCGATFFLDLTQPRDRLKPYAELLRQEASLAGVDAHYQAAPLPDMKVPPTRRHMVEILDTIDHANAEGHCVYVHCWGGIGRTGTVVGCYLVRHGRNGEEALDELAAHWATVAKRVRYRETPQTEDQRKWVLAWSERPL